jgi:hypothetical protein
MADYLVSGKYSPDGVVDYSLISLTFLFKILLNFIKKKFRLLEPKLVFKSEYKKSPF